MTEPIRINSSQPVTPVQGQSQSLASQVQGTGVPSFYDALEKVQSLRFSNHAQKRLQVRNINLDDEGISRLANAVEKAEKRGGKESLVLVDDLAFIVNVKERLVITALDEPSRGEGVFTQIDSVVFADPAQTLKPADNDVEA